jgi:curved DNA-binding protein CbpA
MLRRSYYFTLGIPFNESAGGIRQAFHDIVRRYHPDRVGSERSGFFQERVEAYRVLSYPERRRVYDLGLVQADLISPAPLVVESGHGGLPLAMAVLRKLREGCSFRGRAGASEWESYGRRGPVKGVL